MKKFILAYILLGLGLCHVCSAAPVITASPSSVTDGGSMVITGTGFGAHADYNTSEPYLVTVWEDFDSGTENVSPKWNSTTEFWTSGSDQRANSLANVKSTSTERASFIGIEGDTLTNSRSTIMWIPNDSNSQVLFISAYCMVPVGTWSTLSVSNDAQQKFMSVANTEPITGDFGNQYWLIGAVSGQSYVTYRLNFEDGRTSSNPLRLNVDIFEGEWHRFDIGVDTTRPINEKVSYLWVDGYEYAHTVNKQYYNESPNCSTAGDLDGTDCPREFTGSYITRFFNSLPANEFIQYFDDTFINETFARGEISTSPTWDINMETISQKEIQIPTSWSDDSITFIVNQGALLDGEQYYFYVVNADESVNVNGTPIVFGTAPPVTSVGTAGGAKMGGAKF